MSKRKARNTVIILWATTLLLISCSSQQTTPIATSETEAGVVTSAPTPIPVTPTPEPVKASDMPIYPGAVEMTGAQAAQIGSMFTPWSIQGEDLTSGPYSGYKVEMSGNVYSGFKFYSLQTSANDDIKSWYETQLSATGWTKDEEIKGKNYSGQAWKRGGQVFAVFYPDGTLFMNTLFLDK